IPGTTRDTLEETANLHGIPVVLTDTAGIAETDDPVERLGVMRSRAALSAADLALLVLDAAAPPDAADAEIAALLSGKPTIRAWTKIDLVAGDEWRVTSDELAALRVTHHLSPITRHVAVSALTGAGLDQLAQAVAEVLLGGAAPTGERLVSNPRHRDA